MTSLTLQFLSFKLNNRFRLLQIAKLHLQLMPNGTLRIQLKMNSVHLSVESLRLQSCVKELVFLAPSSSHKAFRAIHQSLALLRTGPT
mmetsp:Transcript_4582/g.15237  ORF Transcript_4582/g.15237 Transcript_4582/m.15237 type:complete len:88 (+) Transcript_4582:2652-2915(+)